METVTSSVTKGGVAWLEMSFDRGKKGLEIYAKADPRVEDFMQSLACGAPPEPIENYGHEWYMVKNPLLVYPLERGLPNSTYTIEKVGEGFKHPAVSNNGERQLLIPASPKLNISFLRIVGIGQPGGVTWGLSGPVSKPYIRTIAGEIAAEVRNLVRDYIVPVHINLRISSQEL